MIDLDPPPQQVHSSPRAWMRVLVQVLLISLLFGIEGSWPPPDPNEAHYLSKARHYWEPHWIEHDFFLNSSDTHLVFYYTLGWVTRYVPMITAAWLGRWLSWVLLAWGWQRLASATAGLSSSAHSGARGFWTETWFVVLSGALYATLQDRLQMAGEWVIGGVEAKGIAYALVFFGLAALVRGSWNRALLWMGAASAIHVLVGGWSLVALGFAWLVVRPRPPLKQLWPGISGALLLALPGLLPGLAISRGASPVMLEVANHVYVYERLFHHLFLPEFPPAMMLRHAMLIGLWTVLAWLTWDDTRLRTLHGVVLGAIALVLCGLAITCLAWWNADLAASLLRFYWYRLGDAFVPMGTALTALIWATQKPATGRGWVRKLVLVSAIAASALHLGPLAWSRTQPSIPRADKADKVLNYQDWVAATDWIEANTPHDAVVLTPRIGQTFKWHAERAEIVTWKDVPQDTRSLVLWWQRLQDVYGTGDPLNPWFTTLTERPWPVVSCLAQRYGAQYILTTADATWPVEPLYRNSTYAVYRVPTETSPAAAAEDCNRLAH